MSTARPTSMPSATIDLGRDRPALSFYTHSGIHPVKPPQPGVTPRVIGDADAMAPSVRIYGRDVELRDSVRLNAFSATHGSLAKLNVGLRSSEGPAPGLYFRGEGIEQGREQGRQYWNPEVNGPLFVAVGKFGPYVTNQSADANVVPGYRAAILSAPGELQFARAQDQAKRPIEILLQGHEELRTQPGSFLSKAIVAYPVDAEGRPEAASLVALRTFMTKAQPAGADGTPERVSMPFQTQKYTFDIGEDGRLCVSQIDGLKSVKEGQKMAKSGGLPA